MSSSVGAMGFLLGKLHSLQVSPEDELPEPLKPHKDKLELLKQDLEVINTYLLNLSGVEAPKALAKIWMQEVRDLSYDIEDFIDKTMHPYSHTDEDSWSSEEEELSTLVEQAYDTRNRHDRYDLGPQASDPRFMVVGQGVQGPVLALSEEDMVLVGIDDSRTELIRRLDNDAEQHLKVVPVLGPAGVGKTTLATQVYRQIGGQFERRIFVRASRMPNARSLLQSMICQVQRHQRQPSGFLVQELIDNLSERLQEKRYLIVIDGLWETRTWHIVKSAFPEGTHCSRILITTDIEEVALECCDYDEPDAIFQMKPLSKKLSTELLFNRVCGFEQKASEQLKENYKEIIRACSGLPLATICIARLLASQANNSELLCYVKEYLSSLLRNNLTSEIMLKEIVGLSYNSLPHHLKTCLLYLSMYPEGYTFLKADFVKQWSAEGFTNAVEGKDTNEVAECYFDELVCRGLVQPIHINFSDTMVSYTVHSIMYEVIRHKSIEENFTTVIDYSNTIPVLSAKVCRLSLRYSNAKYAMKPEGIILSSVRSLMFYGLVKCLPSVTEYEVLRVLNLEFWGAQEELDISAINQLFQLRYVRVTTDIIVKLPAEMNGLKYLETLEIYARVTSVPRDIVHLQRLLHLCLQGEINLSDGINSEDNVRQHGEMTDLHDRHLTSSTEMCDHLKRNLIALISSLEKHDKLKSLLIAPGASCASIYLDCSSRVSSLPVYLQRLELLPPMCFFSRLPEWIGQLKKLCILKIVVRELTNDDINRIAILQDLTVLTLYVRQPTAERIIFNCAAFPVLNYFKFRCGSLRLVFQEEAMPNLQSLNLKFNAHIGEKYGDMVAGLEHLFNLQEITVQIGAAPSAAESDVIAAESAFKGIICRHSRPLSFSIGRVDSVMEETPQFSDLLGRIPHSGGVLTSYTRAHATSSHNKMTSDLVLHGKKVILHSFVNEGVTPSDKVAQMSNAQISSSFPREPKLEFLKQITKDFSSEREVGHGAFGVVYKGILQNGQVVAVKKLVPTSGVHDRRFQNEAANLQILEHRNIVKLLGSCYHTKTKLVERNGRHILSIVQEKFLCYEYLSNGSLHNYIYDELSGLDWNMRFKIILGICNGLHFLHEERSEAIVHLNLKPSNIMLDDNMVPKITDFGLSRLFGEEQTRILTQNVVGWIGYIAPEYHYRGEISVKSDIFSLGVLILEIVTGLKRYHNSRDISSKLLIDYVSKNWTKKSHVESKYPSLEQQDLLQVNRCIELGLNCVETDPKRRPDAGSIIGKLRGLNHEASIHRIMENKLQLTNEFPREPKLQYVEQITGNFSNECEIGRGSFGVVYKGTLQSGEVVAVKRLLAVSQTNQDENFKNEVCSLIDINHRNIVKLIGYCYEIQRKLVESHGRYIFADTRERILCYEYLPRGSLDKYLYGAFHELNWNTSFKIIQGICQGLRFLHELQRPIIHMDLKPSSILLDDNLMPKIADFGLSRIFGEEQTRTLTSNVMGSRGYMAPEYYYRGEVSTKSDIFSLGILIIEIVTGLKVDSNTEDPSFKNLINSVGKSWTKMPLIASTYPTLEANCLQQVKRCIDVGLHCVRTNPTERPSIGEIIDRLDGRSTYPSNR